MKDYFGKDGHKIICKKPCELIIHKQNIEENSDGNLNAFLFGTLLMIHDGNTIETKTITLGTKVVIPIYSSEQIINSEDDIHKIIHFEEGDVIIDHDEIPATIVNVYELFNNFLLGRLSGQIPREQYYKIMINAMNANAELNFPRVLLEIMIGQLFVDEKGTLSRLSNSKVNIPLGVNAAVQNSNAYNSMTFEDPTKSMLINLGKTKEEQTKDPSPLEKYMRY